MEEKCPICGAPMEGAKCNYCGYTKVVETHQSHPNVAQQVNYQNQTNPQPQVVINNINLNTVSNKSKWIAFILCFMFGIFGLHRFYVGKIGSGLLYLFTGGFCGIGWIIDILLILTGSL